VKLREEREAAGALTLYLMTNRFKQEPQYSNAATGRLAPPTDDSRRLVACAERALAAVYREGYRYQKVGILLHDLSQDKQSYAHSSGRNLQRSGIYAHQGAWCHEAHA
jgi:DNA polymerase V